MLKKFLLIGSLFLSTQLLGEDLIQTGVGLWQQNVSGYIKNGDTINYFNNSSAETDGNIKTGNFGLTKSNNPYIWIQIHTLIPFIPNIKVAYTKYDNTGYSKYVAGNVKIWGNVNINTGLSNVTTIQKINSFDTTAYYNFNLGLVDLDLGLGFDYWKGETILNGTNLVILNKTLNLVNKNINIDTKWNVLLPYVYGSFETLSFFNFSLNGYGKYAKIDENCHYEYNIALKYHISLLNISAGYRYKDLQGVYGEDKIKLIYKGSYIELGLSF